MNFRFSVFFLIAFISTSPTIQASPYDFHYDFHFGTHTSSLSDLEKDLQEQENLLAPLIFQLAQVRSTLGSVFKITVQNGFSTIESEYLEDLKVAWGFDDPVRSELEKVALEKERARKNAEQALNKLEIEIRTRETRIAALRQQVASAKPAAPPVTSRGITVVPNPSPTLPNPTPAPQKKNQPDPRPFPEKSAPPPQPRVTPSPKKNATVPHKPPPSAQKRSDLD